MILGSNLETLPIKALLIAHSGFGKTGALASLAKAGYKLHILDLDNGTEILLGVLDKAFWGNVEIETLTDTFKVLGNKAVPVAAVAWTKAMLKLDSWVTAHKTTKDIIVIDSLTMLSEAALRHVLSINNRLGGRVFQSDWGEAQRLVEDVLALLYAKTTTCNILVNAHISYIGGPDPYAKPDEAKDTVETVQPLRGYPTSLGKALSPKIARYFNNSFVGKVIGEGQHAARKIYTQPMDLVDAKSSSPTLLAESYPIATGLADIFRVLRPLPPSV